MEMMMRTLRLAVLAVLTLTLLSACGPYRFRGTVLEPPSPANDFTVTAQDGQPFTLSQQRGNVVALFFGFTNCPDICPTTLSEMKAIRERLGSDADKLKVVFISVDPERDTPERLGRYMSSFEPSFIGGSVPQAELNKILKDYGAIATKRELPNSAMRYTMDHSAYTYLIDTKGQLRVLLAYGSSIDDMTSDIRYLINEG
jgi:protein SCO1